MAKLSVWGEIGKKREFWEEQHGDSATRSIRINTYQALDCQYESNGVLHSPRYLILIPRNKGTELKMTH